MTEPRSVWLPLRVRKHDARRPIRGVDACRSLAFALLMRDAVPRATSGSPASCDAGRPRFPSVPAKEDSLSPSARRGVGLRHEAACSAASSCQDASTSRHCWHTTGMGRRCGRRSGGLAAWQSARTGSFTALYARQTTADRGADFHARHGPLDVRHQQHRRVDIRQLHACQGQKGSCRALGQTLVHSSTEGFPRRS